MSSLSSTVRRCGIIALVVVLCAFWYLVWPTPYRYFVIPSEHPQLIRVGRLSGRIWHIRGGQWYSSAERDEIATEDSEEIKRLCKDAPYPSDPNLERQIEFKGYSFSCK